MLKKTITYTDYNGVERTEDKYFNLTKAELMEMELTTEGGFTNLVNQITMAQDVPKLYMLFKDLILKSYGEKSLDGKSFLKSDAIVYEFSCTEAFSELIMELLSSADAASDFINNLAQAANNTNIVPMNGVVNAQHNNTIN